MGGRKDDDRVEFLGAERIMAGSKLFADRDASDCQLVGTSAVELNQDSQSIAARFAIESARRRADASFPSVADHAGAAADASFGDASAARALERRMRGFCGDVESVDVVEQPVIG